MAPTNITDGLEMKLRRILTLLGLDIDDYYSKLNLTTASDEDIQWSTPMVTTGAVDVDHLTSELPPESSTPTHVQSSHADYPSSTASSTFSNIILGTTASDAESDVTTSAGMGSIWETTATFRDSIIGMSSTSQHTPISTPTQYMEIYQHNRTFHEQTTFTFPSIIYPTPPTATTDTDSYPPSTSNSSSCTMGINTTALHMYTYGVIFLVVAALLLNGLQVIIFYSPSLRKYAFSLYFRCLGVMDVVSLCGSVPRKWIRMIYTMLDWNPSDTLYQHSTVACKSIEFLSSMATFISAWLVVLMACERLNAVYNPYKSPGVATARKAIACCVTIAAIYNGHMLFTWDIINIGTQHSAPYNTTLGSTTCAVTTDSRILSLTFTVLGLGGLNAAPLAITIVLTILIYRGLTVWKIRPRRMKPDVLCRAILEKRATVMICGVTTLYSVLSVPYVFTSIIVVLQTFVWKISRCTRIHTDAFVDITEFIFLTNYTSKFLICILLGNKLLNYK